MNLINPESIEEHIIHNLSNQSLSGVQLLKMFALIDKAITKQALYHNLRKLLEQEIIVKHGKMFSISRLWIQGMAHFFLVTQNNYGIESEKNDFIAIKDGDKISYVFKNPYEADQFWGHVFDMLIDKTPKEVPIVLYNPHQWFLLVRTDSEYQLLKQSSNQGKKLYNYIGGSEILDRYVEKYFDLPGLKYTILDHALFEARNYYVNIFGNYIIEVFIDEKVAEEIDRFYKESIKFDKKAEDKLRSIIYQGKTKLVISHNSKKAKRLREFISQ